jgi:hypothetical protein
VEQEIAVQFLLGVERDQRITRAIMIFQTRPFHRGTRHAAGSTKMIDLECSLLAAEDNFDDTGRSDKGRHPQHERPAIRHDHRPLELDLLKDRSNYAACESAKRLGHRLHAQHGGEDPGLSEHVVLQVRIGG